MSRPVTVDITAAQQPWREVPMPGANLGLELVPLASAGETFTILGRFPAGFSRTTPGGYFGAEEFLVLDGYLELEGRTYRRGDLTFIPAGYLRSHMAAPQGCTVLAWFNGPAIFRSVDELGSAAVSEGITSVHVDALLGDAFQVTSEAQWSVGPARPRADEDCVTLGLDTWWHGAGTEHDLVLRRSPKVSQ